MRLDWQRLIMQGGGGTVLIGDINSHSQWWDQRSMEWRTVAYWEEIIDEHGVVIGTDE
jgi:hypothetical protein